MQENDAINAAVGIAISSAYAEMFPHLPILPNDVDMFNSVAKIICDRLRAGGISNLTIVNIIIAPHQTHREITDR